jgi:hypothetical protein
VGAPDLVEQVGVEDDDFRVRVGPGDLRVDASGQSLLAPCSPTNPVTSRLAGAPVVPDQ